MQENNIVWKIEKEFKHKVFINYDINKIEYEICNFFSQVKVIGKGRLLVVNGVYDLYWKPLYKNKKSCLRNNFQEVVYTDNLPLNFESLKVVSSLQGTPILTQSNYSIENTVLVGNICCNLYDSSQVEKEEVEGSIEKENIQEDSIQHPLSINKKEETLVIEEIVPEEGVFNKTAVESSEKGDCEKRKDIICISSTRWDFIRQRPHHLMELLSNRNNRVLFFNHSVAENYEEAQSKLSNPELWSEKLEKISENLWVFSPATHITGEF